MIREHDWKLKNGDCQCPYWECEHCEQKVETDPWSIHLKNPNRYASECVEHGQQKEE